jgi:hypothetical protein
VFVPLAVIAVEPARGRKQMMAPFALLGAVIAVTLLAAMVRGPVGVRLAPYHLSYAIRVSDGFLVVALYVVAVCGPLLLMLGSGKTGAVGACVTASSARSRDPDIYRRYAAGLYRQALLTRGDPALAEHDVCDVIVNERALARMPERGEDDERYRLGEAVRSLPDARRYVAMRKM